MRLLLAVVVLLLAWAPQAGAVGWVTGEPLSPAGRVASAPQLAVGPSGELSVAWLQRSAGGTTVEGIGVRSGTAGGELGAPQLLASPEASDLVAAAGEDGTIGLAWTTFGGGSSAVHVARRAPGEAAFTEAGPLAVPGETVFLPRIAVHGGDVHVAFTGVVPQAQSSVYAARMPAGTTSLALVPGTGPGSSLERVAFTPGQDATFVQSPTIAASGGTVFVAWERSVNRSPSSQTFVTLATRAPGGNFGAPAIQDTITVGSSSADSADPVLAAGGGRAYLAWTRLRDGRVAYRDLTGGPTLSIAGTSVPRQPQLAADIAGAMVAAWSTFPPNTETRAVEAVVVGAGEAPGPPSRVTAGRSFRALHDLATGPDGSALVVAGWDAGSDGTVRVEAALRPPGGGFGPVEQVSGLQEGSAFSFESAASGAIGPGGRALIAWAAHDGTATRNQRVRLSERDATAPAIEALTVPRTAAQRTSIAMSAAASDSQSAVGLTWDFGDGFSATGPSVSHVYAAPGDYTVTVTARDGGANTATRSATITVTAPPTAGGGDTPPDTTSPQVSSWRSVNDRFRAGKPATALIAQRRRAPVGTEFRLDLSERATLVVTIRKRRKGRVMGTLVRAGREAGSSSIPFSGRLGKARLKRGRYSATVVAIDAAGNRSKAVRTTFRIVR